MTRSLHLASLFLLITLLTACASFPYTTPEPATPTPLVENIATETPSESVEEEIPTETEPQILHIWLPPEFDPAAETDAGEILRARLETFQKRRPDLILEVRIKAVDGQASLLNSLLATQNTAPSAMPDLVALSRPDLERAALAGILHPIDGLSTLLDDPDWFPYARPLAHIQNSAYGLPFAADLFGLAYRPAEDAPALPTVESLLAQETQIIFPADNAEAQLSHCLYPTSGALMRNEQGLPSLAEEELTNLLSFYQSENFSVASADIQDQEVLWEAFNAQPETAAAVWVSEFVEKAPADAEIVPIPAPNGVHCSLASAWVWALAGSSPDLEPAAVELAEYLSDSAFLAEWTAATGTLPPRPTALDENQTTLHELSLIAQPIPSNDITESLGEIFRVATMSVLREQVDPGAAALEALTNLQ